MEIPNACDAQAKAIENKLDFTKQRDKVSRAIQEAVAAGWFTAVADIAIQKLDPELATELAYKGYKIKPTGAGMGEILISFE